MVVEDGVIKYESSYFSTLLDIGISKRKVAIIFVSSFFCAPKEDLGVGFLLIYTLFSS